VKTLEDGPDEFLYKVIVVGEGGVGKTTFINRYTTGSFLESTKITLGASVHSFDTQVNGDGIRLQVWDFGGEKRFRFILPGYCKGTHGVIFVFELTRPSSLWKLDEWVDLVNTSTKNPISLLIGTKADLINENGSKALNDEQIEEFMKQHNITPDLFFKTSSVTGENIENVFVKVSDLLYKKKKKKK